MSRNFTNCVFANTVAMKCLVYTENTSIGRRENLIRSLLSPSIVLRQAISFCYQLHFLYIIYGCCWQLFGECRSRILWARKRGQIGLILCSAWIGHWPVYVHPGIGLNADAVDTMHRILLPNSAKPFELVKNSVRWKHGVHSGKCAT